MKCCAALLLFSTYAFAQTNPSETAVAFITAIDRGDVAAVADQINHLPTQQPAAMALARNLIATRRLASALHDRFGKTADPLGLHPLPTTQAIQDANLAADESHATLQAGSMSLPLRKVDDAWKLSLLDANASSTQQIWLTNHLAAAMSDCADEIAAGKYATLDEAKHALQLKMGAAVTKIMVNDSVTTRPATMP